MQRAVRPTFCEFTRGAPVYPMSGRKAPDLAGAGYETSEWAVEGQAVSYSADEVPADGRVALTEAAAAPFTTRILVHRPPPESFSGVVLVEWLNVSGGQDAAPDFTYMASEILRAGHAWIGVSAQYIAVEGGAAAVGGLGGQSTGLRAQRKARYGELRHPGDAFAYDIVTQVGEYAREAGGGTGVPGADPEPGFAPGPGADREPGGPLGDLRPSTVIAVGESQSAFALTSYVNGVHPRAGVFDAFLLHSRGAGSLPYDDHSRAADITASLATPTVRLRDDLTTPVMVVQAEGDLTPPLNAARARQPDAPYVMTWEIAGQAHADAFQLGEFAQFVDCGGPINSGQQVFVLRAALRHVVSWVRDGSRPPVATPIEIDDDEVVLDALGLARGGVRTPAVEVPVERLIGTPRPGADPMCMLLGQTAEVAPDELKARWAGRDEYLAAYREATDRLIGEGFLLAEDRDEILADARPEHIDW